GIVTIDVGGQFEIDIVPSPEEPMVYATRSTHPRIVLFGDSLAVALPVFFSTPDNLLTMNADAGSNTVSIWRSLPGRDRVSDTFQVPPDLTGIIRTLGDRPRTGVDGMVQGLGLTYGQVVAVLQRLCEDGHVPAPFMLETSPAEQELIEQQRESQGRLLASS
ncbi:MAG: hypothetical protein ACYTFO_07770, partial [Planctomycetota bacterium]